MMKSHNISFVGAGRVAEALCLEAHRRGHIIKKIITPTDANGPGLASRCNAQWASEPFFASDTEILLIAVPDIRLADVLRSVSCSEKTIVAHTAGSFGLEVFPASIKNKAVFYPLQTFTKGRRPDFSKIPVFIEATGLNAESFLTDLASSLGCRVYSSDNESRRLLHAAAVFVSNFTNHILLSGKMISAEAGYSFDILMPLISETIEKAFVLGPENSQTGPAVRNDINTIEKHLELLSFNPELKKIYKELTDSILNHYHTE